MDTRSAPEGYQSPTIAQLSEESEVAGPSTSSALEPVELTELLIPEEDHAQQSFSQEKVNILSDDCLTLMSLIDEINSKLNAIRFRGSCDTRTNLFVLAFIFFIGYLLTLINLISKLHSIPQEIRSTDTDVCVNRDCMVRNPDYDSFSTLVIGIAMLGILPSICSLLIAKYKRQVPFSELESIINTLNTCIIGPLEESLALDQNPIISERRVNDLKNKVEDLNHHSSFNGVEEILSSIHSTLEFLHIDFQCLIILEKSSKFLLNHHLPIFKLKPQVRSEGIEMVLIEEGKGKEPLNDGKGKELLEEFATSSLSLAPGNP